MYFWFLSEPARLTRERAEIERLSQSADWLHGISWFLDQHIGVDVVIRAHDHDYEFRMTYPEFFPFVPPTVTPRDAAAALSTHQYGPGGALCLEWGPDNWHSDVTGAQMLESAHKLLQTENPLGRGRGDSQVVAPSRHRLSIGQEMRSRFLRLYVGLELSSYLRKLPDHAAGTFTCSHHSRANSWLALIHEMRPENKETGWVNSSVPKGMLRNKNERGIFYRTSLESATIECCARIDALRDLLRSAGPAGSVKTTDGTLLGLDVEPPPTELLVLDREATPHLFYLTSDGAAIRFTPVFGATEDEAPRTPSDLAGMAEKRVGIVGLGSIGSKVAISLARMGVRRFYLVDHDLIAPGNLVRHALDWSSVAEHKVDAVAEALSRVASGIDVDVCRLDLTGQESTRAVSMALSRVAGCDLMVDATGNPTVFSLVAAASMAGRKPMVWMEVFAGGHGGLIARSRPGEDPDPLTMRAIFLRYCEEHPAPEQEPAGIYAARRADGEILIASDVDVSIIASHGARLGVDTLLEIAPGGYPYSMYLIGLSAWWVFEAPLHTIPIATDAFRPVSAASVTPPSEAALQGLQFLAELLGSANRADPPAT